MEMVGATPVVAPGWTGDPKRDVAIIDCDIHHNISRHEDLLPYLPKPYQEHFLDQGLITPTAGFFNVPFRSVRRDLSDGDDSKVFDPRDRCSTYEFLRHQHLDLWHVDIGILTGPPFFYSMCALPDPDYATALCRAMNDYEARQGSVCSTWTARSTRCITFVPINSDPYVQEGSGAPWSRRLRSRSRTTDCGLNETVRSCGALGISGRLTSRPAAV